jgi:glycosyltransferase involved in cell wall biosynthesis
MKNQPKISVITPSYNQGEYIEYTIKSVLNQEYPNLEYIIIDGGSSDNTLDIIKKYEKNISYWVSEKDNGQTHAINKGLKKATGEIIGWINSDDVYLNNCLYEAVEYFNQNPTIDIIFSDYIYIDADDKIIKRRKEIPFNYDIYLWTGDCYHANCAGFFKKSIFDKIGYLDETLHYGMDFEFYLRAGKAGIKIGHKRGYWGAYRLHSKSKSMSAVKNMKKEGVLIVSKYLPHNTSFFTLQYKKFIFKIFRIFKKFIIGSYFPFKANRSGNNWRFYKIL